MQNNVFYNPGAFGDIIYSIPFCLSCVGTTSYKDLDKNKYTLILDLCCVHKTVGHFDQAFQNLKKVADLVRLQPYIGNLICQKRVDWASFKALDLGIIRKGRIDMNRGDISIRNNFLRRQMSYYNLYQPWLIVPQNDNFNYMRNKIVVFRSNRYNNNRMNYSCLKDLANRIVFIGTQKQYTDFCLKHGFKCLFYKLNNFIEACQILQKCAFCIGNQTFFFALAQSLKVPRILESYKNLPDVIPHGDNANDAIDTEDFKILLKMYCDKFLG